MPIVGVTDGSRERRWPIIGKIRKGDKRPNGAPMDLGEELRFSGDEAAEAAWVGAFGSLRVREVRGALVGDADEAFTAWREYYTRAGLQIRCDGQTRRMWRRPDGSMCHEAAPCLAPACFHDRGEDRTCPAHGQLRLMVPEMVQLGFAGVVVVETGSIVDLAHLADQIQSYRAMFGAVDGLPVSLTRREGRVHFNGQSMAKWFLKLEAVPDAVRALAAGQAMPALGDGPVIEAAPESMLALPPAAEPESGPADREDLYDDLMAIRDPSEVEPFVERLRAEGERGADVDGLEELAWQHLVARLTPYAPKVASEARLAQFRRLLLPVPTATPGRNHLIALLNAKAQELEPVEAPAGGAS